MKWVVAVAVAAGAAVTLSFSGAGANETSGKDPAAGTSAGSGRAAPLPPGSLDASSGSAADGAAPDVRKLFTSGTTPSCAICHTLRDANATGNIGPDLDALKPDAARVRNAVEKGFENMPAFGHVINAAQIDAVARYVEQAANSAK